ncbi:hypothetical protein CRYUN_Cryun09bG0166400 [Craigia yunnanensis]
MSGAGKKIVDVAFKASKNIDWEGMAKLLVSDEASKEFATIHHTFDEVNSILQTKFSQGNTGWLSGEHRLALLQVLENNSDLDFL